MDYSTAQSIANALKKDTHKTVFIAGSLKRKEPIINDIDVIIDMNRYNYIPNLQDNIKELGLKQKLNGYKYKSYDLNGIKIDFWLSHDPYELKFLKWMRTMEKGKNIYYRKKAREKGLILSDRGLKNKENDYFDFNTLSELTEFLKT